MLIKWLVLFKMVTFKFLTNIVKCSSNLVKWMSLRWWYLIFKNWTFNFLTFKFRSISNNSQTIRFKMATIIFKNQINNFKIYIYIFNKQIVKCWSNIFQWFPLRWWLLILKNYYFNIFIFNFKIISNVAQ